MKRILSSILLVFLMIMLALPAFGGVGLGTRAMGMGGAFTAVADDESAFYWNPAGITQVRFASVMFGVGAQGEDFGFIEDTIGIFDDIRNKKELDLSDVETGSGYINLGLVGGVTTRFVGMNFYSETSALAGSKTDSYIDIDAINFSYGALTIANKFGEKISVGLNAKRVVVGMGAGEVNGLTNYTEYADGDGFAYDIGVLYQLSDQIKFGFIAQNLGGDVDLDGERINFIDDSKTPISRSADLPRDFAVGVSYRPFKNTLLAFDVQKSEEWLFAIEQTRFRIGFEQTALWNIIALRLGAFTNKSEPLALTAGLGFKLGPLAIGISYVREEFGDQKAEQSLFTTGIRF